jgi:hypothetical protein
MSDFAFYLTQGASKLRSVPLARASDGSEYKFDDTYWQKHGQSYNADVLVLKPNKSPSAAVQAIFDHPTRWQFDCSEFVQVVNYYAWLRVLGATDFDSKVRDSGRRLKIKPFMGAVFTTRKHYYRREARTEWMRYWPNGDRRLEQETCMTAWAIVNAAPIGSRINFTNDRTTHPSWRFENTIKVSRNEFLAHGLRHPNRNKFAANDLITRIYREGSGRHGADFAEASQYVWIKEVEYFVEVASPVTCR